MRTVLVLDDILTANKCQDCADVESPNHGSFSRSYVQNTEEAIRWKNGRFTVVSYYVPSFSLAAA